MMKFPFSSKNYAAVFRDITGDSSTDSKIWKNYQKQLSEYVIISYLKTCFHKIVTNEN